jgi:hypothetical protein
MAEESTMLLRSWTILWKSGLPIAIHFTWNFLLGPFLGSAVSGQDLANRWGLITLQGPALFTGGAFGLEGSLVVTIVTILVTGGLLLWYPGATRAGSTQGSAMYPTQARTGYHRSTMPDQGFYSEEKDGQNFS